ncbi:hypothetical protein SAMN05216474_1236 [Lishizhenia tianjinensis]|uniref:ABC transporter ATPase n=1 Tax=Lishizhenia tianjinensis TaxID=477690 RepID=A0A1I6YWE1_9FLAO|nr:hypothetical protein [Lishizhenia tianjinensis]SFT54736.1 hypothetical protein SAMN05216474_1236 [Lishizhenia tianjinensis]
MNQFKDFPEESRVWLYQSNRALSATEVNYVDEKLKAFTKEWAAHGKQLWATAAIVNPYFIAVVVDESITPPSGCSIDASVKFIKELGAELEVDFFTRMQLTVEEEGKLKQIPFHDLSTMEGVGDLLIYDTLIDSLKQLRGQWPLPVKESSLKQLVEN